MATGTGLTGAATQWVPPPDTPPARAGSRASGASPLAVGQNFGTRYHIIRLLGIGGMGAVYQAWDQVLEVAVAVKVIRPPATMDEDEAKALERRFKRELLLARQVTHKNVVRIHDLGEIDGITYITMPYVQGSDLSTILKRDGRLPVDRVLALAKQVGSGLNAAHEAGVVHRDLKPANIMVDAEGDALIMDFGIARSTSAGMTMTVGDAVIGTIEYMAPEQARGGAVDQRADIYAFGLILNDLLLGRRQGNASTSMAALMERMQHAPPSVRSIDPTIPAAVDALVTKCLQPDPALRYQRFADLLAELNQLDANGHPLVAAATTPTVVFKPGTSATRRFATRRWPEPASALLLLVLAGSGWVLRDRLFSSRPQQAAGGPTVSLAILPFKNASGDPSLDSLGSSLSEVLRTELGQSSRVRTVPSDRLHQVLQDLRIAPNATLAPVELARVADFTSARSVLSGQFTRFGDAIRIDATLQDLDRGQTVPLNAMAPNEGAVLTAISKLAEEVRRNLARGSADVLNELKSTSWKPSTSSFDALRLYNEGQELTQQGSHQEALKRFEDATRQDGNFALGYSAQARSYSNLGYDAEATQFSRRAMSLSDALPPQEKYLISANHYRITNDVPKAIEAYGNLLKASPNSATVQLDLGGLYEQSGDFDRAREHFAKVVELDPKFVEGLLALGRVEIRQGRPQDSLEHLNAALTLAIQLNNDEARANVLQAIGIAYKDQGRPDEALRRYDESLEIKRRLGDKRGIAASLSEISQVQSALGKPREAEQSLTEALKLRREIGDKSGLASTLLSYAVLLNETLGRPDEALPLLREALQIRRDAGNQNAVALVLNNIGNVYLSKGQFSDAETNFERALEIREKAKIPRQIADTLHNLAETSLKMGRYDQALSQYHRALDLRRSSGDRRSAAIESYSIGTIFDYQARFGAAVKSKEEALTTFRELKLRDMWLGEILGGYGNSLSLSGRLDEATKNLEEAINVGRELRNPILIAQTMRFQAERLFLGSDVIGARSLADQAAQAGSRTSDRSLALVAKIDAVMMASAIQPTRALASQLGTLSQEADALGLQFLSVDSAIRRAETLLKVGDREGARQEVDRSLARADTLGFRLLRARALHLRGEILRLANDSRARAEYSSALRLLEEIKGEDGNQQVLTRADLAAIHADCLRWSKAG